MFASTRTTISVSQPFELRDLGVTPPAGDYLLDADGQLIEGFSRSAYRRVATLLYLPSHLVRKAAPGCFRSAARNSMRRWKKIELAELSER